MVIVRVNRGVKGSIGVDEGSVDRLYTLAV
jgi:hypothetical protein